MEQVQYNLSFRSFLGLGIDDPVWVPTVFTSTHFQQPVNGALIQYGRPPAAWLDTCQCWRPNYNLFSPHLLEGRRTMQLMRNLRLSALATLMILGATASVSHAQDVAGGAKLAGRYCARCHAVGGTGASLHPSAPPFRAIAAKGHVDDLQEALAEGITVGHPGMPEFELQPEQIINLLAYLKTLTPSGQ